MDWRKSPVGYREAFRDHRHHPWHVVIITRFVYDTRISLTILGAKPEPQRTERDIDISSTDHKEKDRYKRKAREWRLVSGSNYLLLYCRR
jgi:hypothetical protein